ncbi:unnamed protein product [Linum tenue]|uniref:Cation/H+ exchanger domain-containing protein n=2 Tax=Linum tenue TaxID=586396 RepID=A0AAV0IP05_9ROSI|nr:unnamed protein product [Linum tenue]
MSSLVRSNTTWVVEEVCYAFPPRVRSGGVFINQGPSPLENLLSASVTLLNVQVLLILCLCNALHFLFRNLGIIPFATQCLAGVILGPTLLGKWDYYKKVFFPHPSQNSLGALAMTGYSFFMFMIGVKTDVGMLIRSGRKTMIIGIASVLVPCIIGLAFQTGRLLVVQGLMEKMEIIGFTALQATTTFPVVSHLLIELKLTNSELGRLALSSSLISGLLAACLELSTILATEKHGPMKVALTVLLGLFAALVLRPAMLWVIKQTPQGKKLHSSCVPIMVAVAFLYQIAFDALRQSQALGPFILGLAVPSGPPLGSAVIETLEVVTNSIMFPVFVATCAMRGDLYTMVTMGFSNRGYYARAILASLFVKFLSCLLLSLPWMPRADSAVLALIMCSKGIYELSVFAVQRDTQAINESLFSLCLGYIILNSAIIPIIVKYLYDPSRKYVGYQARNLFSLRPNTELRVLTCIHKPHHVGYMINLLDIICPTEENPIGVYALHLVELVGRATPMLISHQKQKAVSDNCSIEVILAFNQYERRTYGLTSVNTFTSISQPKFMHDDICTLALDKSTILLLTPFHITWALDGSIESEDNTMRALNSRVLERAPCSVGIYFNRGNVRVYDGAAAPRSSDASSSFSSAYSVCVLYLGGRDDHEALCLATRMARDSGLELTIHHLVSKEDTNTTNRLSHERMIDEVVLKEALQKVSNLPNVKYIEQVVEDGPQTAMAVRAISSNHDLFVVGRRVGVDSPQTTGLAEWSEFPELGVIGDLLASKDVETKASVLVVQQQKQFK